LKKKYRRSEYRHVDPSTFFGSALPPNSEDTFTGEYLPEKVIPHHPRFFQRLRHQWREDQETPCNKARVWEVSIWNTFLFPTRLQGNQTDAPFFSHMKEEWDKPSKSHLTARHHRLAELNPARQARWRWHHVCTLEPPERSTITEQKGFRPPTWSL